MVAKENYQEPVEDYTDLQDLDEAEDTLSLCDLPIYNDAAKWEYYYSSFKEDRSSTEDDEFFEFFSEDFTASTCATESIIFCGKLISYTEQNPKQTQKLLQNNTEEENPKKRGLFQRKSKSSNKSKGSASDRVKGLNNSSKSQQNSSSNSLALPASEKYPLTTRNCAERSDRPEKVSALVSPAKPRWPLFLFGLMRVPTEMELSDIKNRQHRRTQSTALFQSFAGGEEVSVGKSRGKGLWRLLKALGCRSNHANAVVRASFGCIPSV